MEKPPLYTESYDLLPLPEGLYLGEPVQALYNPAARENLLDNGMSARHVNQIYDSQGNWILRGKDDLPFIYDLPQHELENVLAKRVKIVYDSVDLALLQDKPEYGFNKHDWGSHIFPVTQATKSILSMFGYNNPITLKLAAIAGAIHDTGNQDRRRGHSLESPHIGAALFPDLLSNPIYWNTIDTAVRLHDEPELIKNINSHNFRSTKEIIAYLESLGPVLNALVLADKVDIDRRRSNELARTTDAIDSDMHAWVNVASKNGRFSYDKKYGFFIGVDYNPKISGEELQDFSRVAKKRSTVEDEYRLRVPDSVHRLHREYNIPHFEVWKSNLFDIYHARLELAILCAFALSKDIDQINVMFFDKEAGREFNVGFGGQPFRRAWLDQDILESRQRNMRKEQHNSEKLIKIGTIDTNSQK